MMRPSIVKAGIPVLPRRGFNPYNPWRSIKRGESFIVRDQMGKKKPASSFLNYGALHGSAARYGYKIACRQVNGYVRVWRLQAITKVKRG